MSAIPEISSDKLIVMGMAADPYPLNSVRYVNANGSIVLPYPD
jgi:hypothetical protein